jgi:hypothetical protein
MPSQGGLWPSNLIKETLKDQLCYVRLQIAHYHG